MKDLPLLSLSPKQRKAIAHGEPLSPDQVNREGPLVSLASTGGFFGTRGRQQSASALHNTDMVEPTGTFDGPRSMGSGS